MDFEAFVQDIQERRLQVYGVEVYEDGLLAQRWGDTGGLHEIYSATKTILSIAIGIAWDEGRIDLDASVARYLPAEKVRSLPASQRAAYELITVRRLLTMSVLGLPFRAAGESWLDFSLSRKIAEPECRVFNYSNISAYLAGVCLANALGGDAGAFVEERIFAPLQIASYEYMRCPDGYFYGASGVRLSVHDMSKIGLLLYNGGTYGGARIVSEDYVARATSVQQMNREDGYGFFIWKYRDGCSINGKWGQKCYVLPAQKLVVSFLSHLEEGSDVLVASMEKHVLESDAFDAGESV